MHVLASSSTRLHYLAGPSVAYHTGRTGKRFGGYAREAWRTIASTRLHLPGDTMTHPIRLATTWMYVAITACAIPAFAQNTTPAAAIDANGNGAATQAPTERVAKNRNNEQDLLGAPNDYGSDDTPQRNLGDAQRTAILDGQRMTVTGGGGQAARPATGAGPRKAAGGANGAVAAAGRRGRPNAAEGLTPEGASRITYADPYADKRAVYRSPW
jgi:hypothetical protein